MSNNSKKAIAIIVFYMLVRAIIYTAMPVTSGWDWLKRDVVMTVPRIVAFVFLLLILRRMSGVSWRDLKGLSAIVILLGLLLAQSLVVFSNSHLLFDFLPVCVSFVTTLAVAFFEETCFRGVLFHDMKSDFSPLKAAIISTLIFTVFHLQAQPIWSWPIIFLTGFALCSAYHCGAGLIWLVLVHEIIDCLYMLSIPNKTLSIYLGISGYVVIVLTAVYSVMKLRQKN